MAGSKWLASIALMFWSVSCASYTPKCSSFAGIPRSPGPLDSVVFVIGDAGGPPERSRPILTQLQAQAADVARTLGAERTSVIFVGDNIYPNGLPDTNEKGRRDAEERLLAQLKVSESGAPVSFVAGNHDWKGGKRGGLAAVQRQSAYIDEHRGAGDVAMKPPGGCPGPVVENVGERLRLIFMDTQFWLHGAEEVEHGNCSPATKQKALAVLREQTDTSRYVMVVAHHPLRTAGPHGGYFSFRQHVFPLTDLHRALYVPLPIIGSLYPLVRWLGISSQDTRSRRYRAMVSAILGDTRGRTLLWVGGHEHNLQLFGEGPGFPPVLVSGNGMLDHRSPLRSVPSLRACSTEPGYIRIEVPQRGRPSIVFVQKHGDEWRERQFTTGPD